MSNIEALITEYEHTKKEFTNKMTVAFNKMFVQFFNENPAVKCVVWTQYTPYFNDGEPCTFSVGDKYASTSEYDHDTRYAEEMEGIIITYKPSPYYLENYNTNDHCRSVVDQWNESDKELGESTRKFIDILNKVPDEIYEDMFGDHMTVIATIDGFDTVEYEHD